MAAVPPTEESPELTVAEAVQIYEDLRETYLGLPVGRKKLQAGRAFCRLTELVWNAVAKLENQAVDLEDEGYPDSLTVGEVKALSSHLSFQLRINVRDAGRCGYVLTGPSKSDSHDLLGGAHDLSLRNVLEAAERQIEAALAGLRAG